MDLGEKRYEDRKGMTAAQVVESWLTENVRISTLRLIAQTL
jgi:hypothetical protein